MLNIDMTSKRSVTAIAGNEVKEVVDVLSNRKIDLVDMGWAGGNRRAKFVLEPGDGTFVRIIR